MYIKLLTIKNYRNFGEPAFTVELKPFTLILGENNIGKTNLLNALGLIFSQEIVIFRKRVLELDDINYETVQAFKKKVCDLDIEPEAIEFPEVVVEAVLTDMDEDQVAVVGDWFINKELTEAKVTYVYSPRANFDGSEWIDRKRALLRQKISEARESREVLPSDKLVNTIDFPIGEYRYSIYGGDDPTNECNPYWLRMLKMEFLDALRDAQKELIASGEYRLLYRILCQRDETKYDDIKDTLSRLEDAVRRNENLESIKDEVSGLLDRISLQTSDVDNSIDFNFSSPECSEMLKKISLIYGANPISVDRNGLGRNNLLYISLILSHLSAKESRGSDTFFRLIAIEEPEAHLHPHLEDHLAKNIESILEDSKGAMQLLLTSHSTHIAAKLDLESTVIIFNDTEGKKLNSHYILSGLDQTSERMTIRYLRKYLDATKSRMFFARKIILVEGIAEQLLIPRFFEFHSGSSVERCGCNVINVSGVAFRHFLKVIENGFFIRCVVLTDRDTGTRTQERAQDLKREFDQDGLIRVEITEHATFEKDLIAVNRTGQGRTVLLRALEATRPRAGKRYERDLGQQELDIESFFAEIEGYKSEFAFNLLALLDGLKSANGFTIPDYIKGGFKFLE